MKVFVILLYVAIFISFFYALLNIYIRRNKTTLADMAARRAKQVRESDTVVSWKMQKERRLIKHGVDVFALKDGFTLTKWYTTKVLYAVILSIVGTVLDMFLGGSRHVWFIAPILLLAGFFFPDMLLHSQNETSNKDMINDIMEMSRSVLYSNRGGQYITKALADAALVVENDRLKVALLKLKYNLDSSKSLLAAIDEFEDHFENAEISAFCTVIRSLQETGQVNDALSTLRQNIEREQVAVNKRRCQKLETKTQMNCMLIFTGIILCLVYILFMFIMSVVRGF